MSIPRVAIGRHRVPCVAVSPHTWPKCNHLATHLT